MNPPPPLDGHQSSVQAAIDLQSDLLHLQRDQRRGIATAMHMRLVAGNIGVIDDSRVRNHSVSHRRRWEQPCRHRRRSLHELLRRPWRGLSGANPLWEPQPLLDRLREVLIHDPPFNRNTISQAWRARTSPEKEMELAGDERKRKTEMFSAFLENVKNIGYLAVRIRNSLPFVYFNNFTNIN